LILSFVAVSRGLEVAVVPVVRAGILFSDFVFGRISRLQRQILRPLDRHGKKMKAEQSRKERQACVFE
jgi:hypothetical protein